ncbi:clathrin adaptor complex small chain-domain-containing protein [Geopyxis carbonaria]|nr:clathrin adaptor complex small chain-domain-containing protein [Geopyxis carbonaria]
MINAVLVFNNQGAPRLTKFYSQIEVPLQQRLLSQIFSLISNRSPSACNFLPLPPLLAGSNSWNTSDADEPLTLLYRHYATLYFIVISDSLESPLGLLDLIQVFVQALDQLFENVCELDLIFNFETLHATLEEMIIGGCVVETDLNKIVACVREAGKHAKGNSRGGMGGGGGGGGSGLGNLTMGMGRGGFMGSDMVWTGR